MTQSTILGYPRIGKKRELKFTLEKYWRGELTEKDVIAVANESKQYNLDTQKSAGIDVLPFNDFAYYDQILTHTVLINALPKRYKDLENVSYLERYFAAARGIKGNSDVTAMEMTKWFDTNYHYIVPQLDKDQDFSIAYEDIFNEYKERKAQGYNLRPVIVGPVTYLSISKSHNCDPLDLIEKIIPVYLDILAKFKSAGAETIQIDEPILALDLSSKQKSAFKTAYAKLSKGDLPIFLATYFEGLRDNTDLALSLGVETLHVDLVRSPSQLDDVLAKIDSKLNLSLGVVNGRNIWKNDIETSIDLVEKAVAKIGKERISVASSCSLLHTPYDLDFEEKLEADLKDGLAFSKQKLSEIAIITKAINNGRDSVKAEIDACKKSIERRKNSSLINNKAVQERVKNFVPKDAQRHSPFDVRIKAQQDRLNLPAFPTTTIGSLPQTIDVRKKRLANRKGELSNAEYNEFIKQQIQDSVKFQESIDLDVLVHGEFERNDMVEYFGENINGMAFSGFGWVQSYGSRCVKPPVIFGDIDRAKAITVEWTKYSQSLTKLPMKAMLTGPITMLKWSFVREDIPLRDICLQMAYALRDEVNELAEEGIAVIQIDEPAIREGLPLRKADQAEYIESSIQCYRVSSSGVADDVQIHSHMCYSEFNDIMPAIIAMDSDVLSIEASRSQLDIMEIFQEHKYPQEIGLGVYDIHSPRIPTEEEMANVLNAARKYLGDHQIWVNPDCGLKTRGWAEVKPALESMVKVAKKLRQEVK